VATDHAPHAPPEANRPLQDATFGVIGLETAAAVVNTAVELKPREFFDRLSVAPARLGGFTHHGHWTEKGVFANLAVFDPKKQWVPGSFVSRSSNSPFVGRPLRGKVRFTVYQGRVTHGFNPSVSGGGR
jgi:dihydroorotase